MKSTTGFRYWKLVPLLVVALLALLLAKATFAADPGQGNGPSGPSSVDHGSLTQLRQIVDRVVLSEDACGTNAPSCTIDIVKPSPLATVREAHLFCATVPFGYVPDNDDVTLNGTPVAWDEVLQWTAPLLTGHNTRADVTAIVAPVGNAAPPGVVPFIVTENPSFEYDGCALKVIWDDPTTTINSILIFWGHQETAGDTFVINFAPLTSAAFVTPLEFSLGISFGHQPSEQFSQVDVNNIRLTTSAGGEDDGEVANGALITLGGTGDTTANPPSTAPAVTPSIPDDELYDLRPFAVAGDTSMTIFTINPSNDDNIFLANLFLRNVQVIGPGPVCPPDDDDGDDDGDGLENGDENRLLTLLNDDDSDSDGIVDGNDDANLNGTDDEDEDDDEDDDDDECPDDDDEDDDGEDDEDEDDDEDDD